MATGGDKLQYPKLDGIDETNEAEALLGRADALLSRHIGKRPPATPETSAAATDFPVLTEVVEQPIAERHIPAVGTATTPSLVSAANTAAQDLQLDQMENELRLSLLGQMRPELERLIEMRVNERLGKSYGDIMERTKNELATELRRAVREALTQVVDEEMKRLKP